MKVLKYSHFLSIIILSSCANSVLTTGPEDAINLICENCTISNGVALVGGCPQGYAELKIKEGRLTVNYSVDCGSGVLKASESGVASDLKVIKDQDGNYIAGKWTERGEMLADADLKLYLNKNWEYTYGQQMTLALYNSAANWEYQFTWTETDSSLLEFCKILYSESEINQINSRINQRIPLDYENASDVEVLGFILNSKWSKGGKEAVIEFDESTNTLAFSCDTDYGYKTFYLGGLRYETQFYQYVSYQNLNFFSKGFWSDYLDETYNPPALRESEGLLLESSGGRIYFVEGGFFRNFGRKESELDKVTLRNILGKLKSSKIISASQEDILSEDIYVEEAF